MSQKMTADMIFYFHFLYRNVFLEFTMPNKFLYSRSWGWRMVCLEKSLLQDKLKKLSFCPNKRTKKRRNLSKNFHFSSFGFVNFSFVRLYQISRLHERQLHWAKLQWEKEKVVSCSSFGNCTFIKIYNCVTSR